MWKVADLDLMALANKYWIQKWSYEKLGQHYGLAAETARRKIIRIRVNAKEGIEPWSSLLKQLESS